MEETIGADARRRIETAGEGLLPSPRMRIPGWSSLLGDLGGKTLADKPSWKRSVGESTALFGGSAIELSAGAELSMQTLDSSSESDEDGILLAAPEPSPTALAPVLEPEPGKSWLKYRLEATIGAEAEARLGELGLDFEIGADKRFLFTDYRVRSPSDRVVDALRHDLAAPRFALDRSAVLRMLDGEAVSMRQRGTLRGQVSLTLRDVFTGGLHQLSEILDTGETLRLRLDLAASVTAKIRLTDDFTTIFARHGGQYKVAVRKQDTNSKSLRAEVVAGLRFDNPEVLRSALDQLLSQHLDEPREELAELRRKAEGDALATGEKKLLERLEARLLLQGLEAVQEKLDALEEDLRRAIETIAGQRASLGFSYEYSRLEAETTILEATLDQVSLSELHEQLVQGDLDETLDRLRDGVPGIHLDRYLSLEEVTSRRAWGFNLGGIGRSDVLERRFAIQRSLVEGALRLSFLGTRSYHDPGNDRDVWKVDLRAQMSDFLPVDRLVLGTEPGAAAGADPPPFLYGLGLIMEWTPDRLGKGKLRSILDTASLWGVLEEEREAIEAELVALAEDGLLGESARLALQLSFDHGILAPLLAKANDDDRLERWSGALAAAMPQSKRKANTTPTVRRRIYAPLWRGVLEESARPNFVLRPFDLARRARQHLRREGFPSADEFDNAGQWQTKPGTFGGALSLNRPIARWRSFCLGLDALAEALGDTEPVGGLAPAEQRITSIHRRLESFWNQSHHVRAVGAYLLRCAEEAGVGRKVRASLSASWSEDGEEQSTTLFRV